LQETVALAEDFLALMRLLAVAAIPVTVEVAAETEV
jgi:hypothetical protein